MKKVIFLFAFLMMNALVFGQMTKNVGSHKFENGTEIKEGSIVKFLTGKNPQTPGFIFGRLKADQCQFQKRNVMNLLTEKNSP